MHSDLKNKISALCGNNFPIYFNHVEVNECLESSDVCDKNAVCINTLESYECRCKVGYQKGVGKECIEGVLLIVGMLLIVLL
jgi:hypothetical protein